MLSLSLSLSRLENFKHFRRLAQQTTLCAPLVLLYVLGVRDTKKKPTSGSKSGRALPLAIIVCFVIAIIIKYLLHIRHRQTAQRNSR